MKRLHVGLLVLATAGLAVAAGLLIGRKRAPDWTEEWSRKDLQAASAQVGSTFVLVEHKGGKDGVVTRRMRYVLRETQGTDGVFDCTFDDGEVRQVRRRLRPDVPRVPGPGSEPGHGVYPHRGPWSEVRVPAGAFLCGRTSRTRVLQSGVVLRVDEWWNPGSPFPVQTWERPEADVEALREPPSSADSVPAGGRWSHLEEVRILGAGDAP
jgi:hypothetical protein